MIDTTLPITTLENIQSANAKHVNSGTTIELDGSSITSNACGSSILEPTLFHKVKNQKSILALVVSDSKIYAGTQDGEVKVLYLTFKSGVAQLTEGT